MPASQFFPVLYNSFLHSLPCGSSYQIQNPAANGSVTLYCPAFRQALRTDTLPPVVTGSFPFPVVSWTSLNPDSKPILPGPPDGQVTFIRQTGQQSHPLVFHDKYKVRLHLRKPFSVSYLTQQASSWHTHGRKSNETKPRDGNDNIGSLCNHAYAILYHQASQTSCVGN